jgi:hypothetical protein
LDIRDGAAPGSITSPTTIAGGRTNSSGGCIRLSFSLAAESIRCFERKLVAIGQSTSRPEVCFRHIRGARNEEVSGLLRLGFRPRADAQRAIEPEKAGDTRDQRFTKAPHYVEVAATEFYAKSEYVEVDDNGDFIYNQGDPTWSGCSLTSTPQHKNSAAGSFGLRGKFSDWAWQPQFDIPHTGSVIEKLSYTQIEIVRIMSIDTDGFGPVHFDSRNDRLWEEMGYAVTTFMLDSGGVDMLVQRGDRRFAANAPVFFFKDCFPHGVPPARSMRLLLRVTGK